VRAEGFAGLEAGALVQAPLIRYDRGAGIGWHKDRPVFEHVVGISLGNPATMRFRRDPRHAAEPGRHLVRHRRASRAGMWAERFLAARQKQGVERNSATIAGTPHEPK
jgi:hypothetical protein